MPEATTTKWRSRGFRRLLNAARYQYDGMRHALLHDSAIRQVSAACLVLSCLAALLPVTRIERLILILSLLLIVLVEYINSAIEATVDRISLERHPLSKQAKDLASVAVAIAAIMSSLCWIMIAGPLVMAWMAK